MECNVGEKKDRNEFTWAPLEMRSSAETQAEDACNGPSRRKTEVLTHVAHRVLGATNWWVGSVVRPSFNLSEVL